MLAPLSSSPRRSAKKPSVTFLHIFLQMHMFLKCLVNCIYILHFDMPIFECFISESHGLLDWRSLIDQVAESRKIRDDFSKLPIVFCLRNRFRFHRCLHFGDERNVFFKGVAHFERIDIFNVFELLGGLFEGMCLPIMGLSFSHVCESVCLYVNVCLFVSPSVLVFEKKK